MREEPEAPELRSQLTAILRDVRDEDERDSTRPVVLIVDDEEFMRASLELAFKKHYRLILADSAEQALRRITDDVRAVVLDIKMRDKDGFWTYKAIRERYQHLPIIFYSAYQDLKEPYEIINRYRPYGYLFKGRDFKELFDTVASAVADHSALIKQMRRARALDRISALDAGQPGSP